MKKQTKIITAVVAVVVIVGGGFGVHEVLLQNAKDKLNQAQANSTDEQVKLSKAQNELLAYQRSRQSNLKGSFKKTNFQKTEEVVLPVQVNYQPNNAEIAKNMVVYINELRKLNGISTMVTWNEKSTEQTFIQGMSDQFNANPNQSLSFSLPKGVLFSSYSGVLSGKTPSAGVSESDQERAYVMVMDLYNQSAGADAGTMKDIGDPYSRAYLLYSGKNIGVEAVKEGLFAFDYNYADNDAGRAKAMNAIPLPDITFDYVDASVYKQKQEIVKAEQMKVSKANSTYQADKNKVNEIKQYFF